MVMRCRRWKWWWTDSIDIRLDDFKGDLVVAHEMRFRVDFKDDFEVNGGVGQITADQKKNSILSKK